MGSRLFTRAIVATLSAAALMLPADAQQGSTITLSCNGTSQYTATAAADQKPDPVTNLGIIVNLANRTVTLNQYVLPITVVNATLVAFDGQENRGVKGASFDLFWSDRPSDRPDRGRLDVRERWQQLPLGADLSSRNTHVLRAMLYPRLTRGR
jgi:hypothetical protein